MAIDIGDENVLSRFNKLATMGIIRHSPSRVVPLVDQKFPVSFTVGTHLRDAWFDT
jgi:hypothetical protein